MKARSHEDSHERMLGSSSVLRDNRRPAADRGSGFALRGRPTSARRTLTVPAPTSGYTRAMRIPALLRAPRLSAPLAARSRRLLGLLIPLVACALVSSCSADRLVLGTDPGGPTDPAGVTRRLI